MQPPTGLILAGGRGRRVGGADKGWLSLDGTPLIVSVVERFAPQVGQLLISANRNLERYAALGTVVEDHSDDAGGERFAGPLIGVLSGLRRARTEWLAIVPCDAPRLPRDLVQTLLQATLATHGIAGCARVAGLPQPTFAVMKTSTREQLATFMATGERALHRWFESLEVTLVDFEDTQAFVNINTLPDVDQQLA